MSIMFGVNLELINLVLPYVIDIGTFVFTILFLVSSLTKDTRDLITDTFAILVIAKTAIAIGSAEDLRNIKSLQSIFLDQGRFFVELAILTAANAIVTYYETSNKPIEQEN